VIRKTEGGQVSSLTNPASFRFNAWSHQETSWVGVLDEAALPAYQFINWIKYYRYENGQFVLDWTDEFDTLESSRWALGNWTFDGNLVDFDTDNVAIKDSTLVLAITKEGATGFTGTVPADDGGQGGGGSGCSVASTSPASGIAVCAAVGAFALGALRRRSRRKTAPTP
jgi:MYXO-CTERM domain-containing protein